MLRRVDGFDYIPLEGLNNGLVANHLTAGSWHPFPNGLGAYGTPATITGVFGRGVALYVNTTVGAGIGALNFNWVQAFGGGAAVSGVTGIRAYRGSSTQSPPIFSIYDAVSNAPQLTLSWDAMGVLKLWRGGYGGTLLAYTESGAFDDDRWMFAEMKFTIGSSGSVEVRMNADVILTYTGNTQATGIAGFDAVEIGSTNYQNASTVWAFDDLYICDQTGTVNNDYLGNVQVRTQFTAGPGHTTTFTPVGAATNWQAAQNQNLDDTEYNGTTTIGNIDLYAMQAVISANSIYGVQVRTAMRQDDATQIVARNVLRSGTTQVEGIDHYINESYEYYFDIWEKDPDTGVGWLQSGVNAVQAGPKKQAEA